jgi:hypothetical protein
MAIDPGPTESAYVIYDTDTGTVQRWAKLPNHQLLTLVEDTMLADELVIEMIASYGMAVGKSVFETCVWIGRFTDRWLRYGCREDARYVTRLAVKSHLCHSAKAGDSNVSAAIADRYGGSVKEAKGTKAAPGPLYGLAGDGWAALGVAITHAESGHN